MTDVRTTGEYEAPEVEQVLTPEEVERQVHYARLLTLRPV